MSYTGPTAADFKHYEQRKHVYEKPDAYIGADGPVEREEWVFQDGKIIPATISLPPGCERLFMEILSNASDNAGNSRRQGLDPGSIEVMMDHKTISVKNYGMPIPVEIHPQEGVYVPQMVFGTMLTSSNYERVRNETGTNGIGAKATNIFSKQFMVIVEDAVRKVKYTQVWNENMTICGEPVIEQYPRGISSTTVVYVMDFARFSLPVPRSGENALPEGGYSAEAVALFRRHAIDISFTSKVVVVFNGDEYNFRDIRNYARLYFPEAADKGIIHYQWPAGTKIKQKAGGHQVCADNRAIPDVELIAMDTPDAGSIIAFANSMMTREGTHVTAAIGAVGEIAVNIVNEESLRKLTRQSKGKDIDPKEKRLRTIALKDVKPHISLVLAVRVVNPKFTSQTKTNMHSPAVKISIEPALLRPISGWSLIARLYAALEAKLFATLSKSDGKLRRHIVLSKGIDANNAGKELRHRCILYITEGDSGAGYANTLMGLTETKRDFIGILPMRGKGLNVMNATLDRMEKNKEINDLKKMLGLCECTDYSTKENFAKLRYGGVMIMADSDVDGKHIIGLILTFFYCRFPQLLERRYITYYRTPILRVHRGTQHLKFFTQCEYDNWVKETPDYEKWEHKYFKGLGTSTDLNIAEDHRQPRIVQTLVDEDTTPAMHLAFRRDHADLRKEWLTNWVQVLEDDGTEEIPGGGHGQQISTFINQELILFSLANVQRAIPAFVDGLKESSRKIIYGAHLKWNISPDAKHYKELRVAQFAAYVAENSKYHHGDMILDRVVINMAQNFVGSNNLPWFSPQGQFGSRLEGGKDAAASRYLNTFPESILPYILRREDRSCLVAHIDEGDKVEPEFYYPVIPMILVNGAKGIGTGYSTFIPNHDPLALVAWLRARLLRKPLPAVLPWYRGFKGTIRVVNNSRNKSVVTTISKGETKTEVMALVSLADLDAPLPEIAGEEDGEDGNLEDDEAVLNKLSSSRVEDASGLRWSMQSLGAFYMKAGLIVITELPLGTTPLAYHKWLEGLASERKIRDYRDLCSGNDIHFEIIDFHGVVPDYSTLKLQRLFGMSNMFCLDMNNRPHRYESAADILENFYAVRLPLYQQRKDHALAAIGEEITALTYKERLLRAILEKKIEPLRAPLEVIHRRMAELGIPTDVFDKLKFRHATLEEVNKLLEKIAALQDKYRYLEALTITELWLEDLRELEVALKKIPEPSSTPIKQTSKAAPLRKTRGGKK